MPVMGPSKDMAYAAGDKAADDLLARLEADRGVGRAALFTDTARADWDANVEKLREALRELFWIEAADTF